MKYQKDKDLEFLKNVKSQDLENLVQILTSTKTEELSKRDIYKEFYPPEFLIGHPNFHFE